MTRSAAENLASNLTPEAAVVRDQAALNREMARVLYPGLPGSTAEKSWGDFWMVFNETSKQAGMGAITGGPVGAVVGGLAALITGIIKATAEGKLRKQAAVRWAHQLGVEDASDFPAFLVDIQGMGLRERVDLVHELNDQLARRGLTKKRRRKLEQRKDIVLVLLQLEAAQTGRMQQAVVASAQAQRREAGRAESAKALAARQAQANRSTLWWLTVAAALGGVSAAVLAGGR